MIATMSRLVRSCSDHSGEASATARSKSSRAPSRLPESTRINWNDVILKSLRIKGIYGREMYETWYKMSQLLRSGLDVSPVLTHRFALEEHAEAFEIMAAGLCGKIVLDINSPLERKPE